MDGPVGVVEGTEYQVIFFLCLILRGCKGEEPGGPGVCDDSRKRRPTLIQLVTSRVDLHV